jgi:ubiquinone/menaquinone biosynthesis C-methylase UbiE
MAEEKLGLTFGRVAGAYDRLRPDFAAAAVDYAVASLQLAPEAAVLDLAAGTGTLTRALRARVAEVIAVEPDDQMRAHIGGDARAGYAEAIPLDTSSVDAAFVGDAFVWFDAPLALAELERVLRPGGGLALLWRDWYGREEPPVSREVGGLLTDVYERFRQGRPPADAWRDDVECSAFRPLEHARFEERLSITGRDLADLELTRSFAAMLADDERAALAARIYPHMEPSYELTVVTDVYLTRLP